MDNNEKAVVIGKARFIDFKAFAEWCNTEAADEYFSVKNLWTGCLYNLQGKIAGINVSVLYDRTEKRDRERYYVELLTRFQQYIRDFSSEETALSFNLLYEHPKFDIISFGDSQFLIPAGFLEKTLYKDYSQLPISAIRKEIAGDSDNAVGNEITLSGTSLANVSLDNQKDAVHIKEKELEEVLAEEDDIKNAKTGELAEMQAEIEKMTAKLEAQKATMLEALNAKKAEIQMMKEKVERELFMLESEIYSIRCFLGEVVDFIKLTSGKSAPDDSPIVLFQKLRFLDEELGKAISLYDFDFSDAKLFENFLKSRSDAIELFCPNDKCVSLVRVSKTGLQYGYQDTPYGEMLQEYKMYHGQKIGILVRNGENLYIGWTDDEKINIPDNMFFTPGEKTVNENDAEQSESTPVEEMVSRYFIFSILQGLLENQKIFTLPDGVKANFMLPSEYIIYSAADTWLVDNRYGSFSDIVGKANSRISIGDNILSLERLSDGHYSSGMWGHKVDFERDRNFSRRTHDVHFRDGEIYKINLIEDDDYGGNDYFVSLVKEGSDYVYRNGQYRKRQHDAHANFRVYPDEFINLTYMNSVWLKYIITNRNLGFSGKMGHYAEAIRYLNKALEFVREREKTEQALIEQYAPRLADDAEWSVKLSEWKLEKKVREITDYQAKRFAKFLERMK